MREVADILDRWDGEDHRYFRVRGDDGSTYILRQDLADASWRLHFYRRGGDDRERESPSHRRGGGDH